MQLFRLKYWDSELAADDFRLCHINIDAITSIDVFMLSADFYRESDEYILHIGFYGNKKTISYKHQLNRDNDMGELVKACNASANLE